MIAPARCHWHPERETRLACPQCNRRVCTECVRSHPVGIRCKECGEPSVLPTYRVTPLELLKGIGAAITLGVFGLLALLLIFSLFPAAGFIFFLIMIGLGFFVGEGVRNAVNRRRGRAYQLTAVGGVLLAATPVLIPGLLSFNLWGLLDLAGVGVAGIVAWNRLD